MKRNAQVAWTPATRADIAGKRVVIIGGTGGIGRALSRQLASLGASVLVVGRTFRDTDMPDIAFVRADLSLMREARRVGALLLAQPIDTLIFTNGIIAAPRREATQEGIERDIAVSYLSRLVILDAVAPTLHADARVFIMGYPGSGALGSADDLNAEHAYRAMPVHMNTVAGNEMLVLDAARRYAGAAFFGLNPGLVQSNIRDNFLGKGTLKWRLAQALVGLLAPSAERYAGRIVPLLFSPDLDRHSGSLFDSKGRAILPSAGLSTPHVAGFMQASHALIARAAPA
jgi:NAD(P)-dependent dehydrogenase (short-subunit alcohol dehydrogenase family)